MSVREWGKFSNLAELIDRVPISAIEVVCVHKVGDFANMIWAAEEGLYKAVAHAGQVREAQGGCVGASVEPHVCLKIGAEAPQPALLRVVPKPRRELELAARVPGHEDARAAEKSSEVEEAADNVQTPRNTGTQTPRNTGTLTERRRQWRGAGGC